MSRIKRYFNYLETNSEFENILMHFIFGRHVSLAIKYINDVKTWSTVLYWNTKTNNKNSFSVNRRERPHCKWNVRGFIAWFNTSHLIPLISWNTLKYSRNWPAHTHPGKNRLPKPSRQKRVHAKSSVYHIIKQLLLGCFGRGGGVR